MQFPLQCVTFVFFIAASQPALSEPPSTMALDLNKEVNTMTAIWLTSHIIPLNSLPLTVKEEKWKRSCYSKSDAGRLQMWKMKCSSLWLWVKINGMVRLRRFAMTGLCRGESDSRSRGDHRHQYLLYFWECIHGCEATVIPFMRTLNYAHYALILHEFCVSH